MIEHIRAVFISPTAGDYFMVHLVAARGMAMACPDSGEKSPYDLGYGAVMKGREPRQRMLAALVLGEIAERHAGDAG